MKIPAAGIVALAAVGARAGVTYSDVFREVRAYESTFNFEDYSSQSTATGVFHETVSGAWERPPRPPATSFALLDSDLNRNGLSATGLLGSDGATNVPTILGESSLTIRFTVISDEDRTVTLGGSYNGFMEISLAGAGVDFLLIEDDDLVNPDLAESFDLLAGEAYVFELNARVAQSQLQDVDETEFDIEFIVPAPGSAPAMLFGIGLLARRRRRL